MNSFDFEISELHIQNPLFKTCPKNRHKNSKVLHMKRKFKHHIDDDDSEAEEVERIRNNVIVNPFTDFLSEEKHDKDWVLKTPIKKRAKNKIDSLITKKKKKTIYTDEKSDEMTEIIRGNLFPEDEKNVVVKEFQMNELQKNSDVISMETDASESQMFIQRIYENDVYLSPKKLF
jgi:hypothetical protein